MTEWYMVVIETIVERYPFFIGAFIFIMLDMVSGLIKAFATNSFSSTNVKTGLFHKSALVLVVIMGAVIDVLSGFIPGLPFTVPLTQSCCVLIIGMECMSVLENVVEINPSLKDSEIIKKLLPDTSAK